MNSICKDYFATCWQAEQARADGTFADILYRQHNVPLFYLSIDKQDKSYVV